MANTLRIKRRAAGGSAGAPASLKTSEIAYNEVDDILYIGYGDDGSGNATSIRAVAGVGAFVGATGTQTIAGVKTFSSIPLIPDDVYAAGWNGSLGVPTKNAVYDKIEAIAAAGVSDGDKGDIVVSGSGTTYTIDAAVVSNAKAATMATKTYKGRTTAATGAPEDVPVATLKTDLALVKGDVGLGNVSNVDQLPLSYLDTDTTLAANSDAKVASQKALKAYVDQSSNGLPPKPSCRAATTAALPACTYANGTSGVGATLTGNANGALAAQDGVTLVVNERLLVKDQAAGLQNGLFSLTQVGSGGLPFILTRVIDADSAAEIVPGISTFISEGTLNGNNGFALTTDAPITVGTTALVFTQVSGTGQITDGSGLTKTGNTLDVNVDGSTIEVSSDALRVKDAGITLAKMANMATASIIGRNTAATGVPEVLSASTVRTLLSLVIGTNVQAWDADLDTWATKTAPAGVVLGDTSVIDGGTF